MTLEQRVALNAANKEKAAELQRKQARVAPSCITTPRQSLLCRIRFDIYETVEVWCCRQQGLTLVGHCGS